MPVFIIKSINKFYNAKWIVVSGLFLGVGSLILMPIIQIILSVTTVLGILLVLWGVILWIWSFFGGGDDVISPHPTDISNKPHTSDHKDSSSPKVIVQKSDEK